MCLNLNTCSNSLIDCNDYFTQFLRWQFIARGRAMREKDYIVIIGSANIDVAGYSHHPLNYADSNPGKLNLPQVAWEGISLIIWRYWGKCLAFKCSRW